MVGGQDELVFDGSSFSLSHDGKIVQALKSFVEDYDVATWVKESGVWICTKARLEKQLSDSSSWPSLYRFKFIIKSEINDIDQLKSIFNDIKNVDISSRVSSNKKFTSFSITAIMKSPSVIIKKYKLASKINGIISL